MIFSYNWLQSFFKRKLPKPEKLAELLTTYSFEVGEVKKTGKDFILDIDILPNRTSDCFSYLGTVREIANLINFKLQVPDIKLKEDKTLEVKDFIKVEVKNKTACPRYTAKVITNIKVGPSPKWIKEKLRICGLNSINNVVDIANYVMLETGQPLHAFDSEKLEGQKIIVRFAKKPAVRTQREKITTLDNEKYNLDSDILVIADAEKPVAIAGIKGGKTSEISKLTKTVILESANFNPVIIRKSSKKLNLKTDASFRFEHGIDVNLTEFAILRAAYLIQKIVKGKPISGLIDIYPKKVLPKKIKLDLDYVERLLGIKISKKEIVKILKKLNFECSEGGFRYLIIKIPTFRLDISIPEDLIEEIGRIYGYERIPATFPFVSLIPPKRNEEIFWEDMIKNILKETGFSEVYNHSFISEKDKEILKYKKEDLIEIENPVSIEQKYLRPHLIINLLKNVQKNQKDFKEIKIFELGKIYKESKVIKEKRMLAGVITGEAFYELKGVVDLLLQKLGISNIWYDDYQPTPEESKISIWQAKKCAEIKVDHEEIGFLGEISPKILKDFKINGKVMVFNIDFEKLQKLTSEEHEYRPLSPYPAAVRDLAILVSRGTKVAEVLNIINIAGGSLIRDVDVFDIYEGEELPEGKKNLAFHIIYQAENRTLSSKEIDKLQQKIIKTLEENPEWEVRR